MKFDKWVPIVVILGAVIAAAAGAIEINLERLRTGDLLNLLLTAIFVALVIERAVEVYANNRFDPERDLIRTKASTIESNLAFKEKALERELARPQPDKVTVDDLRKAIHEARRALMDEREKIEPQLVRLRSRKAAYAAALATVLGLGAAIVGVRVLGQFLPMDQGAIAGAFGRMLASGDPDIVRTAELQLAALRFVDVVLTTALLAGGADGIHQIIKRFTDITTRA